MLKSVLRDIKERHARVALDHKKGCLFLISDLNEKIKVPSVSGVYGDNFEPQCQKWCILPLSRKYLNLEIFDFKL